MSDFIANWDNVAATNARKERDAMAGEGILKFDYKKFPGNELPGSPTCSPRSGFRAAGFRRQSSRRADRMSRAFRDWRWELAEDAPAWPDTDRLQELAFSLLGVGSSYRLAAPARSAAPLGVGSALDTSCCVRTRAGTAALGGDRSTRPERSRSCLPHGQMVIRASEARRQQIPRETGLVEDEPARSATKIKVMRRGRSP